MKQPGKVMNEGNATASQVVEEIPFGTLACPSGNRCSVRMQIQKAEKVCWDHLPGPDDREEWGFILLGMALEAAMEEALKYRCAVEALRRPRGRRIT
jgi:hypothetical protein